MLPGTSRISLAAVARARESSNEPSQFSTNKLLASLPRAEITSPKTGESVFSDGADNTVHRSPVQHLAVKLQALRRHARNFVRLYNFSAAGLFSCAYPKSRGKPRGAVSRPTGVHLKQLPEQRCLIVGILVPEVKDKNGKGLGTNKQERQTQ